MPERDELLGIIKATAVLHGDFVLASGIRADWYVDLRRVMLNGAAAPIAGRVMLDLTADLDYDAVGGMTMGADPVATAMMHEAAKAGGCLDAFVVRGTEKLHGLQRRVEGPELRGRRVLIVEDTATTGRVVMSVVDIVRQIGAEVAGVAVVVDRGAGRRVISEGLPFRAAFDVSDLGVT